MADKTAAWLSLMYQTLPLETGATFHVNAFYPEDSEIKPLTINVRPETITVEVGGTSHPVFVCDVPELNEVHYVHENGQLLVIENTDQNYEVRLVQNVAQ